MLVVDVSTTLAWFLESSLSEAEQKARIAARHSTIVVPPIWFAETQNVILKRLRQRKILSERAANIRIGLTLLVVRVDKEFDQAAIDRTWELANSHMLSFYDACYLELARRLRLPLASSDSALCRAANAMNIPLL